MRLGKALATGIAEETPQQDAEPEVAAQGQELANAPASPGGAPESADTPAVRDTVPEPAEVPAAR